VGTWRPSGGPDERADESRVGGGKRLILPDPAPVGLALIKKTTRAEKLVNEIEEIAVLRRLKHKDVERLHGAARIATQKLQHYCRTVLRKGQDLAVLLDWIDEIENSEMPPTDETSPARTVLEVYETLGASIVSHVPLDNTRIDPGQLKEELDKVLGHSHAPSLPVDLRVDGWRKQITALKIALNDELSRTQQARSIAEESWPGDSIEQNIVFQSAIDITDDIRMCLQFASLIEIALDRYENGPIGPETCLRVVEMLARVKEQVHAIEKLCAEEDYQATTAIGGGAGAGWLL